jgi:hypothetical protein
MKNEEFEVRDHLNSTNTKLHNHVYAWALISIAYKFTPPPHGTFGVIGVESRLWFRLISNIHPFELYKNIISS